MLQILYGDRTTTNETIKEINKQVSTIIEQDIRKCKEEKNEANNREQQSPENVV